jgi:hypothetical protein
MNTMTKGLVGTFAAGAMALASASPAYAKHDRDGIDAGDVIAGALIIGGIAAIAAVASKNDRGRDSRSDWNRRGYDDRYFGGRDNPRQAVEQCVNAAESRATRSSYGRADVTDIRDIDNLRDGFRVKGRIGVNTRGHSYRRGENRYGNGWDNDYRGWNNQLAGYDSGKFTCVVRHGRVVSMNFSGIRGLR